MRGQLFAETAFRDEQKTILVFHKAPQGNANCRSGSAIMFFDFKGLHQIGS